jgi:hypothetical protein
VRSLVREFLLAEDDLDALAGQAATDLLDVAKQLVLEQVGRRGRAGCRSRRRESPSRFVLTHLTLSAADEAPVLVREFLLAEDDLDALAGQAATDLLDVAKQLVS